MGLLVLASMLIHVISLDAAGIAVTIAIFAYYSTSRASKSYPGSYDPGTDFQAYNDTPRTRPKYHSKQIVTGSRCSKGNNQSFWTRKVSLTVENHY